MSARRFLFAWRHALNSAEGPRRAPDRQVALVVSLYMNGDGLGAWPSQETLAVRTALTARTVRDALKRLCSERWLSRDARKSPRGVKSKRWGYEYRARLPRKLANAYVNGERPSLFNGKDPGQVTAKKNGEIHDKRIRNDVPTNTSKEYVKNDVYKRDLSLEAEFAGAPEVKS